MYLTFLILCNFRLVNYACNHITMEYLLFKFSFNLLTLSHLYCHVCLGICVCDPLGLIGVAWMCLYGDPNSICDNLLWLNDWKKYAFTSFNNSDLTIVPQEVMRTQESCMYNSRRNWATLLQISRIAMSLRKQLKKSHHAFHSTLLSLGLFYCFLVLLWCS